MISTFHGLEVARRGLKAQQTSLITTGHNIANSNTIGYSRQRVNLSATNAIEVPGMTRSTYPGQLGTGVMFDSITRIRDSFLDLQFRRENAYHSEWSVREQTNMTIETIINEPSKSGLGTVIDNFWNSWEALNRDPDLLSARSNVRAEAVNLADTLNHMGVRLQNLESDLNSSIDIKLDQANQLIGSIAELTDNIRKIEALGDNANDLRDKRDLLVDQLSSLVNVTVTEAGSDYSITAAGVQVVANDQPTLLTRDQALNAQTGEMVGLRDSLALDVAVIKDQLNAMINTLVTGKVDVTLPAGYVAPGDMVTKSEVTLSDGNVIPAGGTIPAGAKLDSSATIEVDGFNGLHALGYTLGDPPESGIPFFVTSDGGPFTIDNIRVNPEIVADTNKIAASGQYDLDTGKVIRGNSDIAHALTALRDKVFTYPGSLNSLTSGTIDDYFRAMTAELGVRSNEATRNKENKEDLIYAIDNQRLSISGVSLDEEMSDMIRFQHAYNAAARNVTAIDEMLDQVINRMGLVGR